VWPLVEDSVEVWLTDRMWIKRKVRAAGTDDGTPNFTPQEYGPYAGKLYFPVGRERFGADREVLEMTRPVSIASDIRPLEKDELIVESKGIRRSYRIEGTVNPRPSAWGQTPIYNCEVVAVDEY
jgi:hypothetical protein